jgi:hypothetical protein
LWSWIHRIKICRMRMMIWDNNFCSHMDAIYKNTEYNVDMIGIKHKDRSHTFMWLRCKYHIQATIQIQRSSFSNIHLFIQEVLESNYEACHPDTFLSIPNRLSKKHTNHCRIIVGISISHYKASSSHLGQMTSYPD